MQTMYANTAAPTTILITRANRGLGLAFVSTYILRPRTTIVACVRDLSSPSSLALESLPKHSISTLISLKIDSTSLNDALTAIDTLQAIHSIHHLDLVIPSAGISTVQSPISNSSTDLLLEHMQINVCAPLLRFQACLPLILSPSSNPNAGPAKFVTLSSSAGSLLDMPRRNFPNGVYGPSKAALNYITRKMHFVHPEIIAFPLDPGWVRTEMGNAGAKRLGLYEAEDSIEDSVKGMVQIIDGATRDGTSGRFWHFNDAEALF